MTGHPVAQPKEGAPLQTAEAFFAPSLFQTLFWKPRFLPEAATAAHLPFLFWLSAVLQPQRVAVLGCDDGAAHFALCQALEKLGHDAQCRGYGFWTDADSGVPLPEPPAPFVQHQAMLYEGLSQLIPAASVEDALDWLGGAPVELLFVDLEAVPKETHLSGEALVPCLAAPGVILLHGTNDLSRRRADGRALARFIQASRHVEFTAEQGLVLIAKGDELPAPLRSLLECTRQGMLRNDIELVFRRSGQGLKHSAEAASRAQALEKNAQVLSAIREERDAALTEIGSLRASHDLRSRKLTETQAELFELRSEIDRLNAAIEAECEAGRQMRAQLAATEAERDAHAAARTALERDAQNAEELRAALAGARAECEAARSECEAERAARFSETATLTRIAEDLRARLAAVEASHRAERREKEKLQRWKEKLLKSTSWRITAPMRSLKETFSRQSR